MEVSGLASCQKIKIKGPVYICMRPPLTAFPSPTHQLTLPYCDITKSQLQQQLAVLCHYSSFNLFVPFLMFLSLYRNHVFEVIKSCVSAPPNKSPPGVAYLLQQTPLADTKKKRRCDCRSMITRDDITVVHKSRPLIGLHVTIALLQNQSKDTPLKNPGI